MTDKLCCRCGLLPRMISRSGQQLTMCQICQRAAWRGYKPAFEPTYARKIALQIWADATWIEDRGNRGEYGIKSAKIGKQYRDGILFYSRGHGWRVRKSPHWLSIFAARFPEVYTEKMAILYREDDGVRK